VTRTIVFAHANGFPAGVYEPIFDVWRAAGWRVEAPARFSHDARYPVTSNWPRLRDQLTDFIVANDLAGAMLVGHSLGGLVSLMAACKRPDLVGGLVMLDSPIVTGWRAHSVHMAKRAGLMERVGPGAISRKRRHEWPSREAVHAHFSAKSAFARWDPRMLEAYVHAGFENVDDKVVLAVHRDIETRIYNTLPHHVPALLKKHPPRLHRRHPFGRDAPGRFRQLAQAGRRPLALDRGLAPVPDGASRRHGDAGAGTAQLDESGRAATAASEAGDLTLRQPAGAAVAPV
jgi:pimeloyl-ACP methyl ester carboxylesterase